MPSFILLLFMNASADVDDGSILHHGEATFYGEGALGHCGFPPETQPKFHGAMNHIDYDSAAACGAWVHITGPKGEVTAFIDDECPECREGDIDLGPNTFNQIAEASAGRVPISWRYVEGGVEGPVSYFWQTGSSQWHIAVQLRNHRYAITSMEIRTSTIEWIFLTRRTYNYFELEGGVGGQEGPYCIRVTDIFGQQVVDSNLTLSAGEVVSGKANFPEHEAGAVYQREKRNCGGGQLPAGCFRCVLFNEKAVQSLSQLSGRVELFFPDGKRIGDFSSMAELRGFVKNSCLLPRAGVVIIRIISPVYQ
jgi:expansin